MTTKTKTDVVKIDPDKCDGCGLCVPSCAEGAIQIIDGKAWLVGDNLCDGLGNCLGTCPKDAITIEQRPADDFDEQAVENHLASIGAAATATPPSACPSGRCPGAMLRELRSTAPAAVAAQASSPSPEARAADESPLTHWPVQLTLLPEQGRIWQGADVVFSADCVAFAMKNFHDLLAGRTLAVACPKLDDTQSYLTKLTRIFATNQIKSITVVHMEVPCCGQLERIVRTALENVGADIPLTIVEIGLNGQVLNSTAPTSARIKQ